MNYSPITFIMQIPTNRQLSATSVVTCRKSVAFPPASTRSWGFPFSDMFIIMFSVGVVIVGNPPKFLTPTFDTANVTGDQSPPAFGEVGGFFIAHLHNPIQVIILEITYRNRRTVITHHGIRSSRFRDTTGTSSSFS